MRYYDLILSDPVTNKVVRRWTSHPNGTQQPPDPGALNIEFDLIVSDYGVPNSSGASVITVEGISLADLQQTQNFAGMAITLKGGMGKGLPLANPAQAGLIMSGQVYQVFGNWTGTEMTLDFVVTGSSFTLDAPGNFSVNWPAGQPLAVGIAQVLTTVYPGVKQNIQITPGIVFPNHEAGVYSTLRQFAGFVQGLTNGYGDPAYPGVSIAIQGGEFFVYDGTQASTTVQLQFQDLVGQPTWIDVGTVQVAAVMRGDIQLGNTLRMPAGLQNSPGIVTTGQASLPSNSKYQSAFQGSFNVAAVRHIGNYRSTDGGQWVSIFNCTTSLA